MKFLCIGDPHFKRDNSIETDFLFSEIERILSSDHFDFVVVLGDTIDSFRKIDIDVLTRSVKFLRMIVENCGELILLIGNHDRMNQIDFLSDISPFYALKFWERTHVVDSPLLLEREGEKFLFVPYVYPGRFLEAISPFEKEIEKIKLIFSHQEFRGASLGTTLSESEEYPPSFPLNISGHIHSFQKIKENLVYVGTPYQQTFGDYSDKILLEVEIFDSEISVSTKKIEYIKKKIEIISDSQLKDYSPSSDEKERIKLIINGNPKKIKRLLSLKKFNEIIYTLVVRDNFNVIESSPPEGEEKEAEIKTTSFKEKLFKKLEKNSRMKRILSSLERE